MNASEILALNSKSVLKVLTKKYGYDNKEISGLRESSLDIRFGILSKYFEELKDLKVEDLVRESSLSYSAEKL